MSFAGVHLFIETSGTALGTLTVDTGCLATLGEIKKEAFGLGTEEFDCICLLRDGQVHKRTNEPHLFIDGVDTFCLPMCDQNYVFSIPDFLLSVDRVHPSPVSRVRGNRMNNQKFAW